MTISVRAALRDSWRLEGRARRWRWPRSRSAPPSLRRRPCTRSRTVTACSVSLVWLAILGA